MFNIFMLGYKGVAAEKNHWDETNGILDECSSKNIWDLIFFDE